GRGGGGDLFGGAEHAGAAPAPGGRVLWPVGCAASGGHHCATAPAASTAPLGPLAAGAAGAGLVVSAAPAAARGVRPPTSQRGGLGWRPDGPGGAAAPPTWQAPAAGQGPRGGRGGAVALQGAYAGRVQPLPVVAVPPQSTSPPPCSGCGALVHPSLAVRIPVCPQCG